MNKRLDLSRRLSFRDDVTEVTYKRNPTIAKAEGVE